MTCNDIQNTTRHTNTHTTVIRLCGFCPGQPGWAGTRRNIHPLTLIVAINHPHLPLHPLRSTESSPINPQQDMYRNVKFKWRYWRWWLQLIMRRHASCRPVSATRHLWAVTALYNIIYIYSFYYLKIITFQWQWHCWLTFECAAIL